MILLAASLFVSHSLLYNLRIIIPLIVITHDALTLSSARSVGICFVVQIRGFVFEEEWSTTSQGPICQMWML